MAGNEIWPCIHYDVKWSAHPVADLTDWPLNNLEQSGISCNLLHFSQYSSTREDIWQSFLNHLHIGNRPLSICQLTHLAQSNVFVNKITSRQVDQSLNEIRSWLQAIWAHNLQWPWRLQRSSYYVSLTRWASLYYGELTVTKLTMRVDANSWRWSEV